MPKEAPKMASDLTQLDALFLLIEGLVFSQSCCSQTQSKDQRLKTIQYQNLAACGKTDEAPCFGFSLAHIFSPSDRELGVHRRKEVTETTEHSWKEIALKHT